MIAGWGGQYSLDEDHASSSHLSGDFRCYFEHGLRRQIECSYEHAIDVSHADPRPAILRNRRIGEGDLDSFNCLFGMDYLPQSGHSRWGSSCDPGNPSGRAANVGYPADPLWTALRLPPLYRTGSNRPASLMLGVLGRKRTLNSDPSCLTPPPRVFDTRYSFYGIREEANAA